MADEKKELTPEERKEVIDAMTRLSERELNEEVKHRSQEKK